jgi:hypothetical protein
MSNELPITEVMDVTAETLRRLGKYIADEMNTVPGVAAWFKFLL